MQNSLQHTIPTTPERFWNLYMLDRDFLEAVYAHMRLKIEKLDLTHQGEGDTLRVCRVIQILPEREMPGFLQKLMKGTTTVTQTEKFDASRRSMELSVAVPVIGDRVQYGGTYSWKPPTAAQANANPPEFVRTWEGYCNARIPLIGGKIESFFLNELTRGIEDMYPFLCKWLARQESE